MRLKPSGLRYLDISRNFNAVCRFVMLFCAAFIYQYFCTVLRFCYVILYGVWCLSVRLCDVRTPLRPHLFGLLSDLKFYYIHVKVSILKRRS